MKKFKNVIRISIPLVSTVFVITLLFSSCKKNNVDYVRTPAAGLMAFNLAPDKAAIGFTLSGNQLGNSPLTYTSFTGAYLPVYLGSREVRSFDYNSGSTIAIAGGTFADSMYYSTFLMGANGAYKNVLVKDELNSLTATPGKAWVRYVNAIPDSTSAVPSATIGEISASEPAPYGTVSAFKPVTAGTSVNVGISNGLNITTSRNLSLEENKIYTVLFVGLPVRSDSTQTMQQVKFIQNGTLQ